MDRRVYRVCRSIHARLDGHGAQRAGGRWNSPGRAVVYMAGSISLAVLENLVHMSKSDFPVGYVVVTALIPDDVDVFSEPANASSFTLETSQEFGNRWIDSLETAILEVPSFVVPTERNYLFNPRHPQFDRVTVESVVPFLFDARLFADKP